MKAKFFFPFERRGIAIRVKIDATELSTAFAVTSSLLSRQTWEHFLFCDSDEKRSFFQPLARTNDKISVLERKQAWMHLGKAKNSTKTAVNLRWISGLLDFVLLCAIRRADLKVNFVGLKSSRSEYENSVGSSQGRFYFIDF